jgi:hypothetical protein
LLFTGITVTFLRQFGLALWQTISLLLGLGLGIALLGYAVGRKEGWSSFESLYWSFITATTVGYGDLRPVNKGSRIVAILIAFLGLTLTGIVIALAVYAATIALKTTLDDNPIGIIRRLLVIGGIRF